jgi:alkaline phosphatase D
MCHIRIASAGCLLLLSCCCPLFAQKTGAPAKTEAKPTSVTAQKAPAATSPASKPLPTAAAPDKVDYFIAPDIEAFAPKPIDTTAAPQIIAFGSCNKADKPQPHWAHVMANQPKLWIWLGDIIYADTTDMKELARQYRALKTHPGYKKMRASTQVIGVYDDHDYGVNDACKDYPKKKEAKKCLMDFMDIPLYAGVRKHEGAYQSYTFGKGEQSIKVIVMDTRYFRDALVPDPSKQRRYLPNTTGTVLGDTQWKWLERELRNSKANLNILCSSVQVIADEQPHEKWGNFPNERKRLLNLIAETKPKNLLIISGDRHMAEVSKMTLEGLSYPLYDFTSSGLTHVRSGNSEKNHFRQGDMIVKENFGVLKVQWSGPKPTVIMQTHDAKSNDLLQEITVKY